MAKNKNSYKKRKVLIGMASILIILGILWSREFNNPFSSIRFQIGNYKVYIVGYQGLKISIEEKEDQIYNASEPKPSKLPQNNDSTYKASQYSSSYKSQKVGNFTFKYPSDWTGGVEGDYQSVTIISPDFSQYSKGHEGTGMGVNANEFNNTMYTSLNQLEAQLGQSQDSEVSKIKIDGLDGIKFQSKIAVINTSPTGNYYISILVYTIYKDKLFNLGCSFTTSRAPANAEEICNSVIQSLSVN